MRLNILRGAVLCAMALAARVIRCATFSAGTLTDPVPCNGGT